MHCISMSSPEALSLSLCLNGWIRGCTHSAETTKSLLSGVDRRPPLGCSSACSPDIPQDLQLCVKLSHTPENSRCTVRAPQTTWWHSAQIAVADGARNLKLGLHGDRSLFPVFALSLSVSSSCIYLTYDWQGGTAVAVGTFIRRWPSLVSSGFGFQRPITRTWPNWSDLSYPLLTECTLVPLLQRKDSEKCSSRCFLSLLPVWVCRRESRLIDCWRLSIIHYIHHSHLTTEYTECIKKVFHHCSKIPASNLKYFVKCLCWRDVMW